MPGSQIGNDQAEIRVFRDGRLEAHFRANGRSCGPLELLEGSVETDQAAPVIGLLYYAMPCAFEHLVVRAEGTPAPLLDRTVGKWPASIDDDELQTYPYLHFLEERKTGMPWRYERWYTLAGHYLVFDSEQYFERPCPKQRGKDWERLIVQLRQIVDVADWAQNMARVVVNLISSTAV
jgi:hypothetical protein